jgi:hypothetical protein
MFAHERSLVEKYEHRPFVLLGVNVDEKREKLQETQEKYHLNWRSWWDGVGAIAARWKVEGLPTLYLLDPQGKIRWTSEGVPSDLKDMDERIEKLVKEAEAAESKRAAVSRR